MNGTSETFIVPLDADDVAWDSGARFAVVRPAWGDGLKPVLWGFKTTSVEMAVRLLDANPACGELRVSPHAHGEHLSVGGARSELDDWRDDPRAYGDFDYPLYEPDE